VPREKSGAIQLPEKRHDQSGAGGALGGDLGDEAGGELLSLFWEGPSNKSASFRGSRPKPGLPAATGQASRYSLSTSWKNVEREKTAALALECARFAGEIKEDSVQEGQGLAQPQADFCFFFCPAISSGEPRFRFQGAGSHPRWLCISQNCQHAKYQLRCIFSAVFFALQASRRFSWANVPEARLPECSVPRDEKNLCDRKPATPCATIRRSC